MWNICNINNNINDDTLYKKAFNNGKKGYEYSVIENIDISNNLILGFHRLAINGYNDKLSDQPLQHYDCSLICNGKFIITMIYTNCQIVNQILNRIVK